jgi:hypothetical protein
VQPRYCPLADDVEEAIRLGNEFSSAIRKLRRQMKNCDKCESIDDFPIIQKFQTMVNEIILEINHEWDIPL